MQLVLAGLVTLLIGFLFGSQTPGYSLPWFDAAASYFKLYFWHRGAAQDLQFLASAAGLPIQVANPNESRALYALLCWGGMWGVQRVRRQGARPLA